MTSGTPISIRARRPISRPAFARWCWERDVGLREAADALGCSYEHVRRICLPFGDGLRRVPDQALIVAIHQLTDGEIGVQQWYPPELQTPAVASAGVLRGARAS